MKARDKAPALTMPIKAKPYLHQIKAFNFVCERFGLVTEGGASDETGLGQLSVVRKNIPKTRLPSP